MSHICIFLVGLVLGATFTQLTFLELERDIALGNIIQLDKLFFKCNYVVRGNHAKDRY